MRNFIQTQKIDRVESRFTYIRFDSIFGLNQVFTTFDSFKTSKCFSFNKFKNFWIRVSKLKFKVEKQNIQYTYIDNFSKF